MLWAIDHRGKTPSDCRSPATSATGALDRRARARTRGGVEGREQKLGLAVAGEPREADDLALARDELPVVRLPLRGARAPRPARLAARRDRRRGLSRGASRSTPPIAPTSFARLKVRATVGRHHLAVAHDDDPVAGGQAPRRECARSARSSRPIRPSGAHSASNCPAVCASSEEVGSSRMTRRAGASETVKARAISTICRRPIDRSCTRSPGLTPWPGKISSSLSRMSRPALRRQPNPRIDG